MANKCIPTSPFSIFGEKKPNIFLLKLEYKLLVVYFRQSETNIIYHENFIYVTKYHTYVFDQFSFREPCPSLFPYFLGDFFLLD